MIRTALYLSSGLVLAGVVIGFAQGQPASPPAETSVTVNGKQIAIKYSAPSMRGRQIFGGLLPYDSVWRAGANSATALHTTGDLTIGSLKVPKGDYTLYVWLDKSEWQLIVNKQTGQWGTEYNQAQDLGRVKMKSKTLSTPQEVMSISFENTTPNSTEMHIRWETTDQYVTITKP